MAQGVPPQIGKRTTRKYLCKMVLPRVLQKIVHFTNQTKNIYCMVHGDDFVNTGADTSLKWFESVLNKEFKIQTRFRSEHNEK